MQRLLCGLVALLLCVGCGKKAESPPTTGSPVPSARRAGVPVADAEAIAVTQERLQEIGRLIEDYASDHGAEPDVETAEGLAEALAAWRGSEVPTVDGWGRALVVSRFDGMLEIRSLGSDGRRDEGEPRGEVTDPAADIVMVDGGYLQWHAS